MLLLNFPRIKSVLNNSNDLLTNNNRAFILTHKTTIITIYREPKQNQQSHKKPLFQQSTTKKEAPTTRVNQNKKPLETKTKRKFVTCDELNLQLQSSFFYILKYILQILQHKDFSVLIN